MFQPQREALVQWGADVSSRILGRAKAAVTVISDRWLARSHRFATKLPSILEQVIPFWIAAIVVFGTFKMFTTPMPPTTLSEFGEIFLPYALLALAPTLGLRLACMAYPKHAPRERLEFHLSQVGRWLPVDAHSARNNPTYGPYGLMVCLMFGLLLNAPVRAAEFMLAVPAMHSAAPGWGRAIFISMAADVMVMSFLYVACFVMAYRAVPLFPRMLLAVWLIDIAMQFTIASIAASHSSLPTEVALALQELLKGNLIKVLISMAVWLPYLILSERVNLTYRLRLRAS